MNPDTYESVQLKKAKLNLSDQLSFKWLNECFLARFHATKVEIIWLDNVALKTLSHAGHTSRYQKLEHYDQHLPR